MSPLGRALIRVDDATAKLEDAFLVTAHAVIAGLVVAAVVGADQRAA